MRTLVLGGIRSGKSRWAEAAITENLTDGDTVCYVATGAALTADPDWEQRIAAHRHRRPPSWSTAETAEVAALLRTDPTTPVLVDDLGGWLTAVLDRSGWDAGSIEDDVEELVAAVGRASTDLVLVSPEVGLTVVPATAAGRRFADELGSLNQRLADCCDRVVLVVAGQPVPVKPTAMTAPG
ncbi:MAG: bifunctional adenosylcobinamide kinase/adenosylcobinamide-phosphate guanylyltransferase [Mycobacterium sp.]